MRQPVASSSSAYFADAMRLREVIEWNRYDTEFQRKDGLAGRVIAVVDANVVGFYMEPLAKIHLVDLFGLTRISSPSEHGRLFTFARITAEFLFLSHPISIGNERGQLWAEPPLLTPGHSGEIERILHALEASGSSVYEEAARTTEAEVREEKGLEASSRIDEFVATRNSGLSTGQSALLRQSVASLVDALDRLFGPSVHTEQRVRKLLEAMRWMQLIKDGSVRPLATHPLADWSVLAPEKDDVDAWLPDLLEAKMAKPHDRDAERLARNDVEAVLQVEALNRRARERPPGRTPLRFVLISGDEALHRVYANRFWAWSKVDTGQGQAPEPQQNYVLRRPLQYAPVLNLRDIPNGYTANALFDDLLDTVDTLTPYVPSRTCGAYALIHDLSSRQTSFSRRTLDDFSNHIERLRVLWRQAMEASSALCAALAMKDYGLDTLSGRLEKLAARGSGDMALVELQRSIFNDIENLHIRLVVPELSLMTARATRRRVALIRVSGPRLPILVQDDFADITFGVPIEDFASELWRRETRGHSILLRLERMLESETARRRVFFFAGVAAAMMNEFAIASRYLRRAASFDSEVTTRTAARHQYERDDIAFLRLVLDRVRMRTVRDYIAAVGRHGNLAKELSVTSFEAARAQSEAGALHLTHYFNLCFVVGLRSPVADDRNAALSMAEKHLVRAHSMLPALEAGKRAEDHLLRQLNQQIRTNLICLAVTKFGFFEDGWKSGSSMHRSSSLGIDTDALPNNDHIVGLWDCVWLWLSDSSTGRRDSAKRVADICAPLISELSRLDDAHKAPADLPVFEFIAEKAKQESK